MNNMVNNKLQFPFFNWHLEISSKCRLACPRCPRTEKRGMYKVTELPLEFIQKNFPADFLQQNVKRMLFCGGQGDPIYNSQFLEIVQYIKKSHPKITLCIITNGSHKNQSFWQELGEALNHNDQIFFSVDGWDNESNQLYRKYSDFDSILLGIQTLRPFPVQISWSTIVFRFNQDRLVHIGRIAKENGADYFNINLSMLFGSMYENYIDSELGFDPLEPEYSKLVSPIERHRKYSFRLNSERQASGLDETFRKFYAQAKKNYKDAEVLPLCMAGNRPMYIDAEGFFYPCSWVSHPFGVRKSKLRPNKQIRWKESYWNEHKHLFDLKSRSLPEITSDSIFTKLYESWFDREKLFVECESKCAKDITSYATAYAKAFDNFSDIKMFTQKPS